jgi:1,4-alpha-glucan branching enzyme
VNATENPAVSSLDEALPGWVAKQRWYAGKGRVPRLKQVGGWTRESDGVTVDVRFLRDDSASPPVVYQVPLTRRARALSGAERALVVAGSGAEGREWVYDGPHDPAYVQALLDDVLDEPDSSATRLVHSAVLRVDQSNTSVVCELTGADPVIVKVFRILSPGANPDVDLPAGLFALGSRDVPATRGSSQATWDASQVPAYTACAQTYLTTAEDAWRIALRIAGDGMDFTAAARELGETAARIHRDLASAFPARPATEADRQRLVESVRARFTEAVAEVPDLERYRADVDTLLASLDDVPWPQVQRVHGDFHLGQILRAGEHRWLVVDFEGEPLRPIGDRVQPDVALRDVAGMLRSFDYAAGSIEAESPKANRRDWATACREAFLQGYGPQVAGTSAERQLLRVLELDKALYEVVYEARNRPTWIGIPAHAVERLVHRRKAAPAPLPTVAQVIDESAITAFLEGRHSQPHDLLGHHVGPGGLTITAYRPMARTVRAKLQDGRILDLPHVRGGLWSGTSADVTQSQDYRLLVTYDDGIEHEQDDSYRFAPTLGELDRFLFNEGRHEQLWEVLGSHVQEYEGPIGKVRGVAFAVWAPAATAVHVVGDFNGWDRRSHPMRMLSPSGVWELFIPGAGEGMNYQYAIRGRDTHVRLKADPMAQYSEVAPKQASVVYQSGYKWGDDEWMQRRRERNPHNGPMSIYEVHVGSWRQGHSYRDLAEHLVNYVKDLGFTHVEFMPVMEHPYVPSWGYHVTGYYAVSSRWGTPDEFKLLVDYLHRNDIGVILDWVPGHFATDQWALARFDGEPTYEHGDWRRGWHKEWGSFIFDFGRPEVRNFLVANACYWLQEFHIDGLRVDGVASMLYLDYSREAGEWEPNVYGGRENLDAVSLLQEANATAYKRVPGVVTIAEESTSWGGVSKPTEMGGLGFGFKWNMGWMNDCLRYLALDPVYRQYHHNHLTFALIYAFSENFVLPISHDEVVHGKGSLMRKSRGGRDEQIATLRAFLAYMWSHPGKQLVFMGCEFAQESEWSDARSLDWWLLDQPTHYRVHAQVKDMNRIYRANRALWELDHSPDGFRWLNADDAGRNTYSYLRFGSGDPHKDAPVLATVANFAGYTHEPYRIGLPRGGGWRVILDTAGYRPEAPSSAGLVLHADWQPWDHQPFAVNVTVPAFSTVWLVPDDNS